MALPSLHAISSNRDDLRTRSEASGLPHGCSGRKDRERREDGADDHTTRGGKLGVCAGIQGGHNLPAAKPHQEEFRNPGSGRVLIARELRAARRSDRELAE